MSKLEFATAMQARTKKFAIEIIRFFAKLPKSEEARILGRQLLRSGTSVAANYRAVCRAKSQADFISKLGTTVEEADETLLWLELLQDSVVCSDPSYLLSKPRPTSWCESCKHLSPLQRPILPTNSLIH